MNKIDTLSLGVGVQSSTLALMASKGELPKPKAGIFSDTKIESLGTYLWLSILCGVIVKYDAKGEPYVEPGIYQSGLLTFPIHIVSKGNLQIEILKERINQKTGKPYYSTYIPAFVVSGAGRGILRRKCTHDFKMLMLTREQSRIVGLPVMKAWRKQHKVALKALKVWKEEASAAKREKRPIPLRPSWAWDECQNDALCSVWIGISRDEIFRVKDSNVPWAKSRWPLIENRIDRDSCVKWLKLNGYEVPPKSSCIWCPYHDDEAWLDQKENRPEEFARSVAFEKDFQRICQAGGTQQMPFLHDSLVSLDKVVFNRPAVEQGDLFTNECEGMCGV